MRKLAVVCGALLLNAVGVLAQDMMGYGEIGVVDGHLADKSGKTLYMFDKDAPSVSNCGTENGCLAIWPVFSVDVKKIKSSDSFKSSDFANITRKEGSMQTTYKGMPLYYFAKDDKAGVTNGDNVKNVWHIIKLKK